MSDDNRGQLRDAQRSVIHSEELLQAKRAALARAQTRRATLLGDLEQAQLDDQVEAKRLAEAFSQGAEPTLKAGRKTKADLEAHLAQLDAAISVLDAEVNDVERELTEAKDLVAKMAEVIAEDYLEKRLARAMALRDELLEIAAELTIGKRYRIQVPGLWNFLLVLDHEFSPRDPKLIRASALLRAWIGELEHDPAAQPSVAKAISLEEAEAAARAAAEAKARAADEAWRAECEARRKAEAEAERERQARMQPGHRRVEPIELDIGALLVENLPTTVN